MKSVRTRLLASTLLVGAASLAQPAFAQVTPQEAQLQGNASTGDTIGDDGPPGGEDIVVTGTLIRNPNLTSAAPVNAVSEQEIELQQANVAEELLRELPGAVPSIGSAVNNGNGGASFVDLRGLGTNRNVVLIDGVRLVPAGLGGQFDLNNIPVALVQRVDVLTGGSSTTYGADAISGVVNFITKTDFSGVDLQVSNQITEEGDGNVFRVDATIGANFDDGRGNAVFSIGYQESDPVFQGDRGISIFQVDSTFGTVGGSGTTTPSRFTNVNPTGTDFVLGGSNQGNRQINDAGTAFRTTGAFTAFNFNPFNVFQTPFERFNMYGAANYEIADGLEVYTRGLFSKNTVSTIIAPSGTFGLTLNVSLNNPFLTAAQRNAFCQFDTNTGAGYTPLISPAACAAAATATGPGDPNYRQVSTTLSRRAVEAGPRISDFTTQIFDYRLGFRGDITDSINWDVFGSYGESRNDQLIQGYTLNSRTRQSLLVNRDPTTGVATCQDPSNGCVPVNFFGPTGSITPDQVAFLTADSQVGTQTTLAQGRATIAGDLGFGSPLAEDGINFAVGGEYRKYTASQVSDLLSQGGDLGGAGGAAPNIDGGYDVYEAIGELVVPLVSDRPFFQELTVQGGIRYSHYTVDAPGSPSFNTTTWKAGGTWEPFDGFKLRGNYARAVRAPNIGELFTPVTTGLTNLTDDPCANLDDNGNVIPGRPIPTGVLRDVCIAQGAPAGVIGQIAVPTAGQANSTGGGNPNLEPETSNSYTFGLVFTPQNILPGFSGSIDYFNIKVKGAVSSFSPDEAIDACFAAGNLSATNPNCTIIRRSTATGSLSGDSSEVPGLFLALSNLGDIATDGIDLNLNYARDIGPVGLALGFVGTWTNSQRFRGNPAGDFIECVGRYGTSCGSIQPEFQWSQRTTISYEDIDVSLLWRHLDSVRSESGAAFAGTLGAGTGFEGQTVDFNRIKAFNYFDLTTRIEVTENFSFVLSAQNLFDKKPPLVGNTIGSTTFNSGNTYPSTYDAVGRRFAATARVRF